LAQEFIRKKKRPKKVKPKGEREKKKRNWPLTALRKKKKKDNAVNWYHRRCVRFKGGTRGKKRKKKKREGNSSISGQGRRERN